MDAFYDFLELNSIYVVLFVVLIIWVGLFLYMNRIDSKLKKLERDN